jgi:hypothetical protein
LSQKLIETYNSKTPDQKKVIMLCILMVGVIIMLIGLTLRYNALVKDYNELLPEVNTYRTSVCYPIEGFVAKTVINEPEPTPDIQE